EFAHHPGRHQREDDGVPTGRSPFGSHGSRGGRGSVGPPCPRRTVSLRQHRPGLDAGPARTFVEVSWARKTPHLAPVRSFVPAHRPPRHHTGTRRWGLLLRVA